jgi:hypothetical protein
VIKVCGDAIQKGYNETTDTFDLLGGIQDQLININLDFDSGFNQTIENKVGYISKPEKNNSDGSYTFIYVTAIHNDSAIRSFDDARGLVTNDYQQVLEQQWIIELKKKYPIKINDAVWKTVK